MVKKEDEQKIERCFVPYLKMASNQSNKIELTKLAQMRIILPVDKSRKQLAPQLAGPPL
jgi:hypothetical protein